MKSESSLLKQRGFIALTSAMVISALLIVLTFTLNANSFFNRFAILETEYKARSLALAEACADYALLKIAQDPAYTPSNERVVIGSEQCVIVSVIENLGQRTVVTRARVRKATTNIKVVVNAGLSVVSWEEVP